MSDKEGESDESNKKPNKVYQLPRKLPVGSPGLHRPISPGKTVFLLKENPKVDRVPATKGNVDGKKCILKFKDTKGNIHKHKFPDRHAKKWEDGKWVAKLNKWRNQTINRKFKYDPERKIAPIRRKWTMAEKDFMREEIKKRVEVTGQLNGQDWKDMSEAHKQKFAGKKVLKGEQLTSGKAPSDYEMYARSHLSLRGAYEKMPDLKAMVNEIMASFTDDESSEIEFLEDAAEKKESAAPEKEDDNMDVDGDGSDSGKDEEEAEVVVMKHGGNVEHHLEDPSDDEDSGRRPSSNQTGATLVAAR